MSKTLTGLFTYPIKSCKGLSLKEVAVGNKGPEWDRRWMLVDATGRFITQRKYPELALVTAVVSGKHLEICFPDGSTYLSSVNPTGDALEVEVWKDRCMAQLTEPEIHRAFSDYLKIECRLVFIPEDSIRPVNTDYAVSPQDQVSFADGFPFLVISEASLEDLNARLEAKVPMNRFRPNLVISGCKPYEEDSWKRIRIGELELEIVKPCSRCVVTTVEQSTGVKGLEPLQTLALYRKGEKGILFGQNAIHLSHGTLKLGDRVEVEI
ncbi:MAG: MOSC domain-containing protein [Parachlamydiaceae bacterium]